MVGGFAQLVAVAAESRLAPKRDAWPRSLNRGFRGVIPPSSLRQLRERLKLPPGTIHNEQRPERRSLGSLLFRAPKQARIAEGECRV